MYRANILYPFYIELTLGYCFLCSSEQLRLSYSTYSTLHYVTRRYELCFTSTSSSLTYPHVRIAERARSTSFTRRLSSYTSTRWNPCCIETIWWTTNVPVNSSSCSESCSTRLHKQRGRSRRRGSPGFNIDDALLLFRNEEGDIHTNSTSLNSTRAVTSLWGLDTRGVSGVVADDLVKELIEAVATVRVNKWQKRLCQNSVQAISQNWESNNFYVARLLIFNQ